MNYSDDFRQMIKKYNDELKKMSHKAKIPADEKLTVKTQAPVTTTQEPPAEPVQQVPLTPEEQAEEQQANQFPFTNSYELPSIDQSQVIKGQIKDLTGEGYLIVRVFTANQAAPVPRATVLLSFEDSNGEKLISSNITNSSGETPKIALPTVPASESLQPGIANPYAAYKIRVSASGYFTIDSINVPIFDQQTAEQPVEMLPLPEGYSGKTVLDSVDTGPIDLQ